MLLLIEQKQQSTWFEKQKSKIPPKTRKTGGNRPHRETLLLGKAQQETSVNLLLLHHLLFRTGVSKKNSEESLPQVLGLKLQVFFLFQRNDGQIESVR